MDASNLYFALSESEDWSGYTISDVRAAFEFGILSWLPPEATDDDRAKFLHRHESQIEYLFYLLGIAITLEEDDPSASIDEMNRRWQMKSLSYDSRIRFRSVYENTYFYKFINAIELQRMRSLIAINADDLLDMYQAIEYFMTGLLFPTIIEEHPGVFISYRNIEEVSERRANALDTVRNSLGEAYQSNDLREQFVQVFSLMTDYPWSVYRDVHNAMGYLLAFSKSDFKNSFLSNLDRILEDKGAAPIT